MHHSAPTGTGFARRVKRSAQRSLTALPSPSRWAERLTRGEKLLDPHVPTLQTYEPALRLWDFFP